VGVLDVKNFSLDSPPRGPSAGLAVVAPSAGLAVVEPGAGGQRESSFLADNWGRSVGLLSAHPVGIPSAGLAVVEPSAGLAVVEVAVDVLGGGLGVVDVGPRPFQSFEARSRCWLLYADLRHDVTCVHVQFAT
jgi:hypothetical protein